MAAIDHHRAVSQRSPWRQRRQQPLAGRYRRRADDDVDCVRRDGDHSSVVMANSGKHMLARRLMPVDAERVLDPQCDEFVFARCMEDDIAGVARQLKYRDLAYSAGLSARNRIRCFIADVSTEMLTRPAATRPSRILAAATMRWAEPSARCTARARRVSVRS